jgi:hypothetical protein
VWVGPRSVCLATAVVVAGALMVGLMASGSVTASATVAKSETHHAKKPHAVIFPGLSMKEHAALEHEGAFGKHPVRVLLLGDSIALTLGIGMSVASVKRYGVAIDSHATLGCDLDPSLKIRTSGAVGPATGGCKNWRALWPFLVAGARPQVVVLGLGRWEVTDHLYRGHWVHIGDKVWDDHVAADLRHAITIFGEYGAKAVLFTMPLLNVSDLAPGGKEYPENTPGYAVAYNKLVEQVAREEHGKVTVIPLEHLLNPLGVYTSTVQGVVTRWTDGIHMSNAGGQLLQAAILPELDRLGLEAQKTQQKIRSAHKAHHS